MVERLRDFVVPYVRRDSSLHIATQVTGTRRNVPEVNRLT
jgi:hypothetical protein